MGRLKEEEEEDVRTCAGSDKEIKTEESFGKSNKQKTVKGHNLPGVTVS